MDLSISPAAFLSSCQDSGDQAYANFKELLERLDHPDTRAEARRFLAKLENFDYAGVAEEDLMRSYNFHIHRLALGQPEGTGFSDVERSVSPPQHPSDPLSLPHHSSSYPASSSSPFPPYLTLLEMHSIFMPEDWSFTFYEGLTRQSETDFSGKDVCELGCGNGWITIALAQRWAPRTMYGLDINPRAVRIARVNLYLNAMTPDGSEILDREGRSLLQFVQFHDSDLLQTIREKGVMLDRVVGCIPQVLSPDPEATLAMVSEGMSEEFLHSLSNYCGLQGFIEDQFGLGLIARAVEETIALLRPSGSLILNMGGRPGHAVCERLFQRRGFHIQRLWQTRVNQAADTDILPLVEIERSSRHRFEFFLSSVSQEPVSARTAYAFMRKGGGPIAHGLSVYECRLRQPNHVKTIFAFLQHNGFRDTRSALDLLFPSDAIADEKVAFLAHLALKLSDPAFPCSSSPSASVSLPPSLIAAPAESSAGSRTFRSQIASFLRLYFRIPLTAENVLVLPSRATAIESLLRLFSPSLALVESSLTRSLPKAWLNALEPQEHCPVVLEAPHSSDLVLRLSSSLRPQLLILSLADFEMRSPAALRQLLDASKRIGARLFIDISDFFELSSDPATNGVLQFLAEEPLPPHAAIICGLVKNQVYSDMEACFLLSESAPLLSSLSLIGHLSYGHTPYLNQLYYGCILQELLSFQIQDKRRSGSTRPLATSEDPSFIPIHPLAAAAFSLPALAPAKPCIPSSLTSSETQAQQTSAVAIPVDSSSPPPKEFSCPSPVRQYLFEAFARQHLSEAEMDPSAELRAFLSSSFGLPSSPPSPTRVSLSLALSPIFFRLMLACAESKGTLLFPPGTRGSFLAAAKFCGVEAQLVPSTPGAGFKITPEQLSASLASLPSSSPWVLLPCPVACTTGQLYSQPEIHSLLDTCQSHGARVILDASASCFLFNQTFWAKSDKKDEQKQMLVDLSSYFQPGEAGLAAVIIGELYALPAPGATLFSYVASPHPSFADVVDAVPRQHGTKRFAAKKIFGLLQQQEGENPLCESYAVHTQELSRRAQRLGEALSSCSWSPIPAHGGLALIATPPSSQASASSESSSSSSAAELIAMSTGLEVQECKGNGLDGFFRFSFMGDLQTFECGIARLKAIADTAGAP